MPNSRFAVIASFDGGDPEVVEVDVDDRDLIAGQIDALLQDGETVRIFGAVEIHPNVSYRNVERWEPNWPLYASSFGHILGLDPKTSRRKDR